MDSKVLPPTKTGNDLPKELTHVLNVKDLKDKASGKSRLSGNLFWYDKLIYWILISLIGSAIFGGLALINIQFIYIAPIWPVLGMISWFIRKVMKDRGLDQIHEEKEV